MQAGGDQRKEGRLVGLYFFSNQYNSYGFLKYTQKYTELKYYLKPGYNTTYFCLFKQIFSVHIHSLCSPIRLK